MNFGGSAILGAFVASWEASRRNRGPVAFRLCLSADLALSAKSVVELYQITIRFVREIDLNQNLP
jgi:hypothetical protein